MDLTPAMKSDDDEDLKAFTSDSTERIEVALNAEDAVIFLSVFAVVWLWEEIISFYYWSKMEH